MKLGNFLKVISLFIIGILITTFCIATNETNDNPKALNVIESAQENRKEISIPSIGMKMKLSNDLYDVMQGLRDRDEKVEKFQNSIENFAKAGIVFDAVDSLEENPTKEVVVAVTQNSMAQQINDLTQVKEENLKRN